MSPQSSYFDDKIVKHFAALGENRRFSPDCNHVKEQALQDAPETPTVIKTIAPLAFGARAQECAPEPF